MTCKSGGFHALMLVLLMAKLLLPGVKKDPVAVGLVSARLCLEIREGPP